MSEKRYSTEELVNWLGAIVLPAHRLYDQFNIIIDRLRAADEKDKKIEKTDALCELIKINDADLIMEGFDNIVKASQAIAGYEEGKK